MDRFIEHHGERVTQRYASTKFFGDPAETTMRGLMGEKALCSFFGVPQDLRNKPHGDRGIDLMVQLRGEWFTVDVKTNRFRDFLHVPVVNLKRSTLYVAAHWAKGDENAILLGWKPGHLLKLIPGKVWRADGGKLHSARIPENVFPMAMLKAAYTGQWRHS